METIRNWWNYLYTTVQYVSNKIIETISSVKESVCKIIRDVYKCKQPNCDTMMHGEYHKTSCWSCGGSGMRTETCPSTDWTLKMNSFGNLYMGQSGMLSTRTVRCFSCIGGQVDTWTYCLDGHCEAHCQNSKCRHD
jgi:hypothetical protein